MRRLTIFLLFVALPMAMGLTPKAPLYKDASAKTQERVMDLLSRMTLEEKIDMLGGTGFATKPNARLGIPELKMTDGPVGVRWYQSTAFPSGISMGASFDRELVRQVSGAMAIETRAKGRDLLLGPCVGLSRVPFGGRNFESMGEDPFLTTELGAYYVKGLRDHKVVGSIKHFALNDQEYRRMDINSIADERTMHEIHFPAYQRAINEGVGTVMASYNLINGIWASENDYLLNQVLKQQWGFDGLVVSDWGAVHSTVPAALAGLDLEMPTSDFFGEPLLKAVQAGEVSETLINDKVARILRVIFDAGLFDGADKNRPAPSVVNNDTHKNLALEMSRASHVLLKNSNHALPIDLGATKNIAILGPNAVTPRSGGGGSSMVNPFHAVSPVEGMLNRVGDKGTVTFGIGIQNPVEVPIIETYYMKPTQGEGHGFYGEYFNNKNLEGDPVLTRVDPVVNFWWDNLAAPSPEVGFENYSVRWTGEITAPVTGRYEIKVNGDDGYRLFINDELAFDEWKDHGPTVRGKKLWFIAGKKYKVRLEYYQAGGNGQIQLGWVLPANALKQEAVRLANEADVTVLVLGFNSDIEGEAIDREGFTLPAGQSELIEAVVKANPRTVLVINSGNPVDMRRWIDKVPAVIYAWYPGEQGGNALADIVLGRTNPSARLPITMMKRWEDSPAYGTYPETEGKVVYKEGIYLGYRYYDKYKVDPMFAFGHGLSYTTFEYTDLEIKAVDTTPEHPQFDVTVTLTNTGRMAGAEIPQLYVRDLTPHIERPMQELKGFHKVFLNPGESQKVKFTLDKMSFAYYDVELKGWKTWPGQFTVRVGSSSRDIRLEGGVELKDPAEKVAKRK